MPAVRAFVLLLLLLPAGAGAAASLPPAELLAKIDRYPHTRRVEHDERDVLDYEIGLGAIQKRQGVWQFKKSERLSGRLTTYTWQIVDGFSAIEVLQGIEKELAQGSELRFACDARACGQGSQWANGVFGQRLLYGRDENQRYRVYGPPAGQPDAYRVLLFSAARLADRQYLHAEVLEVRGDNSP